ncbi:hypothetical protein ACIOD1_03540 [Streptomyces sp. NPDC088097]|uniref:hypothetical protein n=1 Tax=Streptomyces sp. NPDC088097 TaxID=3365823 RepID=UPI0037F81F77
MSALTPPLGRPLLEPIEQFPVLADLRSAVLRNDLDAVLGTFASLTDEDDRALACRTVAEAANARLFLQHAMKGRPGDPLLRAVFADHLIMAGWNIRTGQRAEHVSRAQFDSFHAHLREAEVLLIDLCAEHPDHALAWYLRVINARGLELGTGEAVRRHERLAEHHPHHYSGQMQLLQKLCPKWGGTFEEAHEFARARAEAAPEGGPHGALVALAQMEHYLELRKDGDRAAAESYLREPAQHTALARAAARSVLHPAARADAFHAVGAHNAFAAAHSAAGRHAEAAPHFRALGDRASSFPWGYVDNDAEAAFTRHRKTALAKG